jgi:hypothetical protein
VWPSDVDDFVRKLDTDMQTTDKSAHLCTSLPTATLQAWSSFLASWQKFRDEGTGWFGAGGRWDAAHEYEKDLANWQSLIGAAKCDIASPVVQPDDTRYLPWIALLVGSAAVVYLFGPAIRATASRLAK